MAAGSPYATPIPSQYAVSFALTPATSAPLAASAIPPAVYPGPAQSTYYFQLSYSQSLLWQLQYGTAYTVCYTGQLTVTPHIVFGDSGPSTPFQIVTAATGTRVFASQTQVSVVNLTGVYNGGNFTSYNFLFPLAPAHVDSEGLGFVHSGALLYAGGVTSGQYTAFQQLDDTQTYFLDTANPDTSVPTNQSFLLSATTPFPASSCPQQTVPAPAQLVSSGGLPRLISTIGCPLQVGSVVVGVYGDQCPRAAGGLSVNVVASGVTVPFQVNLIDPTGAVSVASCTGQTLNQTNPALPQQFSCFPYPPSYPTNAWIGVQVRTLSGYSNVFPGLLFGTQSTGPWPPAIYSVNASNCSPPQLSVQQQVGYLATTCPPSSSVPLTINGEWFDATTTVTVGGLPCASQTLVSANVITCVQPAVVAAFPGAARVFNVQVNNTVGVSLQYGALYIGGPIVSYYTGAQSFSAGFAASSATNLNLNATQEPTCLVDYAAVWARSSSVEMWSVSGGINYETDTTEIVHSSDGFATSFRVVPTITTAGATLRNRRAGGGVRLVNGTGYQGNTTLMWGGNTDDNVGDAAIYITQDDFITISRPRTNAAPVPCPFPACTTSPVYARMAYAVLPFTNYIVQAGGGGNGLFGSSDVYVSTNQAFGWTYYPGPFPAFLSGAMVALFDSAAVPGSGSTATYSTLVLLVPGYPATTTWVSTTGGVSWLQSSTCPWSINLELGSRKAMSMAVDADNHVFAVGGNTATADLWVSADKGVSWSQIPVSGSTYAASYASCLGVRYVASQPVLVLYSGRSTPR